MRYGYGPDRQTCFFVAFLDPLNIVQRTFPTYDSSTSSYGSKKNVKISSAGFHFASGTEKTNSALSLKFEIKLFVAFYMPNKDFHYELNYLHIDF